VKVCNWLFVATGNMQEKLHFRRHFYVTKGIVITSVCFY